jgi:L-alanine-DL-glutamate epimerase-like enolase superfamily enzyme
VAHGLATAGLLATDLLASPLTVVSGRMAVLDGPGLGVEVDDAAVMRWGET